MRRRFAALTGFALLATACGGDDDNSTAVIVTTTTSVEAPTSPTSSVTVSTDPPTSAETTDVTAPTSTSPTSSETTAPPTTQAPEPDPPAAEPEVGDPDVATELVVSLDRPVDLAVRPGDGALHLVNQSGTVVRVDPETGASTTTLDVTDRITYGGEQGLLGLEFSPDGSKAYTNHSAPDGSTVITEYTVGDDGVLDPASARELLTVAQPYRNHNAGDLAFGTDGMLYVPLGDGGAGGDPERRSSDPTSLLGSLLRIDPTPDGTSPYSIPADNPFAEGPRDGVDGAPEVWAWGLRNPWKVAFDPTTGALWIADVGQNQYEEVNRVMAGDLPAGYAVDFGWSGLEGTEVFNEDDLRDGTTLPVLTYEHGADGCSISGGAPYRGSAIDELEPAYVYSDYCSGIVWALDLAGGRNLRLLDGLIEVTAVRPGPDGELYVLQGDGDVLRLVAG